MGADLDAALIGVPYALLGVAITLSTMFVKQHFIADVVTAIVLAAVVFGAQYRVFDAPVRPQAHHEAGAQVPKKLFFVAALAGPT